MKQINVWASVLALAWTLAFAAQADVTANWNQDANGTWSAGSNWAGGNAATGTTGVATFSNAITANRTVTVDASPWTINGLIFGSTDSFNWTVAGGTLNLAGSAPTLTANSGASAKVSSVISGSAGLTKAGGGALTLSGANTYGGDTTVSAGALQIGDGTSATATAGSGALAVGGNTLTLNLSGPATLPNTSVTSSGLIQNTGVGQVTLTNGNVVGTVDGGSAGIVLARLIQGDFRPKGDVTFGSDSTAWTIWCNYPGITLHIVNNGVFWWIGGTTPENAPNFDIAAGVTASLSLWQGYGTLYYNNFTGLGNFTFDGDVNQRAFVLGTCTMSGTITANRPISFGNGGAGGAAGTTPIAVTANGPVTFNSTTDNTYSGCLSGAGTLIKTNSNTLTLSGANTYSGTTMIGGGTLAIGGAGTLGSGSYAAGIANNGTFLYGSSATQTLFGVISGSGGLSKTNSGTLTLSGYNTYSGATRIGGGKLIGTTGGACANSALTVSSGGTNGVKVTAYGDTWTCAGLTYENGAEGLELDLTLLPVNTGVAPLTVNGDLTVAGAVGVTVRNGTWPATGTYPLIRYTGALNGLGAFTLASLPAGLSATLVNNTADKRIDLQVTAVPTASGATSTWTHLDSGNASGDWGTSANWSGGVPDATDATADFSTLDLTTASSVNNDAPRTVGTLRFADTNASHDWTVANAPITLSTSLGLPTITVLNRQAEFAAGLAGTLGFLKNGSGTLRLSALGNNTFGGQVVVAAGMLYVYRGASLKNTSGNITVFPDACLDIFSDWDGNPLTVPVYLSGRGSGARGALHIESNLTVNGPITLVTDTKLTFENYCTINGPITATGAGKDLEFGQPGLFEGRYSLNIYGSISLGTGALTFRSVPGGASETGYGVALNAANAYSGGTVLTDYAILRLGNAGALGSGGITLAPTACLDLYTCSVTIPWLSGTGGMVTDKHGAVGETTLTVNQALNTTFSGSISNGPSRTIALVKRGSGALALAGTNAYTGATSVSNGILCVSGALASPSVTVCAGCGFGAGTTGTVGRASLAGTLALQSNSLLLVDTRATSADTVSVAGDVLIGSNVEARISDDTTSAGRWKILESTGGTLSGNLVLVAGVNTAHIEKIDNAIWLSIPPKGTQILIR